ncbi:MAG: thioredoxin domain-containing protein [Planctomycetota bacterium]
MRVPSATLACALAACGGSPSAQDSPLNHLAHETSPYLLQHARNPVDWYPWGEEALARAKKDDKPIFLSIGYAACHWCHVMEHESFEDPAIAKLLNDSFVCIKVDREERPDLDEIYMAAVQGMTGSGGWPMSVWLTPDLKPFYAGTYFPPNEGRGMPSFRRVNEHVLRLWKDRRDLVVDQAQKVTEYLAEQLAPTLAADDPTPALFDTFLEQSARHYDPEHPGFASPPGYAPKFPHASEILLLLRRSLRSGDARGRDMALATLRAMADGGIHDQLAGGFHRYAVDREWLVPHFEKMLYDNALLAQVYCEAFASTGEESFAAVARDTLDYLVREMQDPAGGFWSSTDADSEGEEGRFFVWSKAEIDSVCGDDARAFCLRHGVSEAGNWEGHNVLLRARGLDAVAKELGISTQQAAAAVERARVKLLAVRGKRVAPATDDKVLAAWNGMAIAALAIGHQVLGEERWLRAAQRAAGFVNTSLRDGDGRLLRSWRRGVARLPAYLEDYGFVADALMHLFESDGDPRWLLSAKDLVQRMTREFGDEASGSFFFTAHDHETLLARTQSVQESSTPSGIAMAVESLLRLALLCGDDALTQRAQKALRAHHALIQQWPISCPSLALAADHAMSDPREVVIAVEGDPSAAAPLLRAVWRTAPRDHAVLLCTAANRKELAAITPLVEDKQGRDGVALAFVCRRGVCEAPTADAARLAQQLRGARAR